MPGCLLVVTCYWGMRGGPAADSLTFWGVCAFAPAHAPVQLVGGQTGILAVLGDRICDTSCDAAQQRIVGVLASALHLGTGAACLLMQCTTVLW